MHVCVNICCVYIFAYVYVFLSNIVILLRHVSLLIRYSWGLYYKYMFAIYGHTLTEEQYWVSESTILRKPVGDKQLASENL